MASIRSAEFPTYAVSIVPGASQRESAFHYYPPAIAVPVGTKVAWFNNDPDQPHTVTSRLPGASDAGSMFNSGVMLATAPTTIPLDNFTPVAYNITIYKDGTNVDNKVFSRIFVTTGTQLPLELIKGSNDTRSYGPDFSGTGAYHLEGSFLNDSADYTITAEIAAINGKSPDSQIMDEFRLQTVT
jgi:plastocyanin